MRSVVTGGTGVGANIAGVTVAGKTGTAEVDVGGERKNHAWFVCFAPVERSEGRRRRRVRVRGRRRPGRRTARPADPDQRPSAGRLRAAD